MEIKNFKNRTWVEIDLDNIAYNYNEMRKKIPENARICCVVKADAYGHGAVRVAKHLERIGADFFAVSNIDEALQLRRANISSPILILGYTPPEHAKKLATQNIAQCVYSYEYAKALASKALEEGVRISVHIKIDTGMGRLGFVFRHGENESLSELLEICSYSCFDLQGIFTHFPTADDGQEGREATKNQFERFIEVIEILKDRGITFEIRHCANSAAALQYPEYSLDMVRLGIVLYGALPSEKLDTDIVLKNTLTLKTVVSNIKYVQPGDAIGYGSEYVAKSIMRIATLPIGYADGFHRINYTNGTKLSVCGKACPIVGRICMDQLMIDTDCVQEINIGDEVVVFGEGSEFDLAYFAKQNNTIPYEILCTIGARVPRFYRSDSDVPFV